MTGKLKTKGNMMFATKLDGVLKASPPHYSSRRSLITCSTQAAKTKAKL